MNAIPKLAEGDTVAFDIDATTDLLTIIADWKDELRGRIARTELVFLYEDAYVDLDALKAEVSSFKRVCACLAWRGA